MAEEKFVACLERACPPGPCLLLAHNAFSFHAKVLLRVASGRLLTIVSGFADSLPALRKLLPGRKGYSVSALQADLVPDLQFEAHDAVGDAKALSSILQKVEVFAKTLKDFSATVA